MVIGIQIKTPITCPLTVVFLITNSNNKNLCSYFKKNKVVKSSKNSEEPARFVLSTVPVNIELTRNAVVNLVNTFMAVFTTVLESGSQLFKLHSRLCHSHTLMEL